MTKTPDLTHALFWSKVDVRPSRHECWEWKARRNENGYGMFRDSKAHRVAYELTVGPIPEGLVLRHHCDNPACCNPFHLEPGSQRDNVHDSIERGTRVVLSGERHARSKLSDAQRAEIEQSLEPGVVLAKRYGLATSTISYIRNRAKRRAVSLPG